MFEKSSEVMDKAYLDVVRRLAILAEYREGDNSKHLERIRGYCRILARGVGIAPQDAEMIAYASQLHDVGKIGLPVELLSNPSKLMDYQWELTKQHTIIGAAFLRGSPSTIMQIGEVIALTHHERWDGSGYPKELKGDNIPLSGRICAIADVFDALTTPRAYKSEIAMEDALNLIREASGNLFDPELVEIFEDHFPEINKVYISNT